MAHVLDRSQLAPAAVPSVPRRRDWRALPARDIQRIKLLLHVVAMLPLLRLFVAGVSDATEGGLGLSLSLGANPIEFITRSTGTWTLAFLSFTLLVTPLRQLTGANWLIRLRRMIGLYVFFYAVLHLLTYVWFDQWFDWNSIVKDVIKRPFITVGFAAMLLLVPLAVTSTDRMMRRLGRRWGKLHMLIYAIAPLGATHYWWLVKRDLTQPALWAAAVALLLGFRIAWRLRAQQPPSR